MKNLILISAILFSLAGYTQTVNDVPISEIDVEYIELRGASKMMSNKMIVEIEYGQQNKFLIAKDAQIRDENGKVVVFNSMIDAMNFFSANGYELVNAYAVVIQGKPWYHWVIRKK